MHLTTQHWLGIGGAAALLGYLLWPKGASAASIVPPAPKPAAPPPKATYSAPPSSKMTDDQKYSLGLGNGTAMGNRDAAAKKPNNPEAAAATFSSLSTDISGSASYRSGFFKGYTDAYSAMSSALVTGQASVGYEHPNVRGSWYGQTFLPSYWHQRR